MNLYIENSESDINYELVAPTLKKPGIRIKTDFKDQTFMELVESNKVSKELLNKYGFIIVENYTAPRQKYEKGSGTRVEFNSGTGQMTSAQDSEGDQMLHRDTVGGSSTGFGVTYNTRHFDILTLRYTNEPDRNDPLTAIMERKEFLKETANFINSLTKTPNLRKKLELDYTMHDSELKYAIDQIRKKIDLDPLAFSMRITDPDYGSYSFFRNKNIRSALIKYIRDKHLVYEHKWENDQLLIIDNVGMVHGKTHSRNSKERFYCMELVPRTIRAALSWKHDGSPVDQFPEKL